MALLLAWSHVKLLGVFLKVVVLFRRSRRPLQCVSKHQTVPQPRHKHSRVHGARTLDKMGCKWQISFLIFSIWLI